MFQSEGCKPVACWQLSDHADSNGVPFDKGRRQARVLNKQIMRERSLMAQLLTAVLAAACAATSALARGSPESAPIQGCAQRRAIIDALGPAVEAELGPGIVFAPSCMQVQGGWAFVMAEPQRKGGGTVDRTVPAGGGGARRDRKSTRLNS